MPRFPRMRQMRRADEPEPLGADRNNLTILKPARGTVVARFRIPEERIAEAKAATEGGEKHEPKFLVEIVDSEGVTVADVEKTLYIRRKKT